MKTAFALHLSLAPDNGQNAEVPINDTHIMCSLLMSRTHQFRGCRKYIEADDEDGGGRYLVKRKTKHEVDG